MRLKLAPLLLFASLAIAQPISTYIPCIDTLSINSTNVFTATITELCTPAHCAPSSNVVLTVDRVLKGTGISNKTQFTLNATPTQLAAWQAHSDHLLIFLSPTPNNRQPQVINLSDPNLKILNAQLTLLQSTGEILQTAQSAIDHHPNVTSMETFEIALDGEVAKNLGPNYSWPVTWVPADSGLELWAHNILRHKPAPGAAPNDVRREQAVNALHFFKSPQNIRLLKSLLNDPTFVYTEDATGNKGNEVITYNIREKSFDTLQSWQIEVPKPLIEVTSYHPEKVTEYEFPSGRIRLVDIQSIERFPNINSLNLLSSQLNNDAWHELTRLTNLQHLEVSGTNLTDKGLTYLQQLPHLQTLHATGTNITDTGFETLAQFPALTNLEIYRSHVTLPATVDFSRHHPNIKIDITETPAAAQIADLLHPTPETAAQPVTLYVAADCSLSTNKKSYATDDSLCHLESQTGSIHPDPASPSGRTQIAEQVYVLQNTTAAQITYLVRQPVNDGWHVDSEPQPAAMDGKYAVFNVIVQPAETIRLHVGMRRNFQPARFTPVPPPTSPTKYTENFVP